MADNVLYYGDNLEVLRLHVPDESVDLIYLDPPFNSNANYNVLFKKHDGARAASQIQAFEDTWRWDEGAARVIAAADSLRVVGRAGVNIANMALGSKLRGGQAVTILNLDDSVGRELLDHIRSIELVDDVFEICFQ